MVDFTSSLGRGTYKCIMPQLSGKLGMMPYNLNEDTSEINQRQKADQLKYIKYLEELSHTVT